MLLSVHSSDRAIESSVIGGVCLSLIPKLFYTASMPETRRNKGKGKEIEVVVGLGRQGRQQNEVQDESRSQTSSIPTAPEEPENSELPPEPPVDTTVQELKNAVQLLTRIVASQGQRQEGPVAGAGGAERTAGTRIRDFLNLDPPSFTGSDPKEDPQDFIDQIQRILDVMHVGGPEEINWVREAKGKVFGQRGIHQASK